MILLTGASSGLGEGAELLKTIIVYIAYVYSSPCRIDLLLYPVCCTRFTDLIYKSDLRITIFLIITEFTIDISNLFIQNLIRFMYLA